MSQNIRELSNGSIINTQEIVQSIIHMKSTKNIPLFIGHRGMGINHAQGENTIGSINTCGTFMSMAEIDVQLSKDMKVFVYHDLVLNGISIDCIHSDILISLGIPLLSDVLLSTTVDLNIEIKYEEQSIPVDVWCKYITQCVKSNSRDRFIIYSSFNKKICEEIKKTQDILYLVEELTEHSVQYVISNDYTGIVTEADEVLNNTVLLSKIKQTNLLVITYGKGNSDYNKIDKQIEMGVNGIITDIIEDVYKKYIKIP
ncbi:hypothetical protein NEPAR06_2509 [Nematocida parisii]|uniref:GP-PDE domain-containing protein n=1 Tax=Nematocida parisii (strain ERTm3) TaxID=935791 RepID=I3EJS3_NEMP3|nr:uncharacterized protein NEPG_01002 [Nematocida parisii ERTm1]EIJ89470.1 hypothetical protein NEQG_00240 [Nematocida parisii ERTm3]KAI5131445.1 hypothetical protein NEPAR03_2444 [Nematocida parisii]EIJ94334.1 hypothetical protein NEPG_01002 [Nematocida parisii ERTm1]KAI5131474.1 hypothetical protein NEPAR08_2467 [Nematocida parisii]KAI5146207.1 hypothetical protein NEPAR04_2575 [Nematocida parisii]|eukprot:XP_013058830.1 hypothetical protein NEPG_01002 [Nematocida parisii ERTm1]